MAFRERTGVGAPSTCRVCLLALAWGGGALRADDTSVYAVLVTATVEESPARITLHWDQDPDPNANPSYSISRKAVGDTGWGSAINLGNALVYNDTGVTVGSAYEYQIEKTTTLGYTGYGYIYTGIRATTVPDRRGKIVLLVDNTFTTSLAPELARLEEDLRGDGWTLIRHDVLRDDESTDTEQEYIGLGSPANQANARAIRDLVIADFQADPGNVKAVLLFGRVPIFRSGNTNVDEHLARPMPADGFYGEMDGTWTTATESLPSDVDLQVGRIDLSRMPGKAVFNGPSTFPSELELLRQYLNKDHNFRHGRIAVQRRAIVGEGFGARNGEAFGASGWRNFAPFFGSAQITRAPINTTPGSWQELVCDTANAGTTYLWAEGDGAGSPTTAGALGTHGQYLDVWTRDLVGIDESGNETPDIKAVFTLLFGSFMGEWDRTDNLLRSVLASRTMGLTASWSGRPHHYYQHMGLGETVGYGMRLSMNNDNTLYKTQIQDGARGIHIALMGDPTLRMHPVKPVAALTVSGTSALVLNWAASDDSGLLGYNVYRSASATGPFVRLNASPVTGTAFSDAPPQGTYTYMVRAVKLESGSGTYLNMSQGLFITAPSLGGGTVNLAPSVSAGPDRTTSFPFLVTLQGLVSDDGIPNASVAVGWSKVSGPGSVYFANVISAATVVGFSEPGTYVLRLTGNDGSLESSDDVVVTLNSPVVNQAPVVNAGEDQTIILPALASLMGTVGDDGVPNATTANAWSKTSGPGTVQFADVTSPVTVVSFSEPGTYILRLTGNDGSMVSSDEVLFTVVAPTGNQAPVVDAGADQTIGFPELAILAGTVSDDGFPNPPASTTSHWTMVGGPGPVVFGNSSASGTTAGFSNPGVYTLRLTVDDGALMAADEIVVTVNPASGNGDEYAVDASTIALYHFNGDYTDSSGNGYHLSAAGGVSRSSANLSWMSSPVGEVARLSALGDQLTVHIPDDVILGSSSAEISLEARIFVRAYQTDEATPNAAILQLVQDYDAQLTLRDSRYHSPTGPKLFGPVEAVVVESSEWNAVTMNAWHRLLITLDATNIVTCYLDGIQIGESIVAPTNRQRVGDWTLVIGNFDGDVDEVRLSNGVRSPGAGSPPVSFGIWQTRVFTENQRADALVSGPEADPDRDGLTNVLEYALALDPLRESSSGIVFSTETLEGKAYLRFAYSRPANPIDLSYEPQVSADLRVWTDDVVEIGRTSTAKLTEAVTVRDALSTDDAPRRFLRLNIHWAGPN